MHRLYLLDHAIQLRVLAEEDSLENRRREKLAQREKELAREAERQPDPMANVLTQLRWEKEEE